MDLRSDRNQTVDALRAVAALAVCLFHFTRFDHFKAVSFLEPVGRYGALGVEVFFVVSGFIVPYAMLRARYSLRAWPTFMWKRLVRLEPPYLVSIALLLVLDAGSMLLPWSRGEPPEWTMPQVASHIGYAAGLLGYSWLNPVYWSLAIELQFYLLCAVLVPALVALKKQLMRLALILALAALPLVVPSAPTLTLVPHLPTFALGLLTFLAASGLIAQRAFWLALVVFSALLAGTVPLPVALAGSAAAITIACLRLPRLTPIAWLATLSYSLYLAHVPIGVRVLNLGARLPATPWLELALVVLALVLSIGTAYALHAVVERPSRRFAERFGYA
jgi:peptidoglycan/LPS O-acetylase OafA/YrhL